MEVVEDYCVTELDVDLADRQANKRQERNKPKKLKEPKRNKKRIRHRVEVIMILAIVLPEYKLLYLLRQVQRFNFLLKVSCQFLS